MEVDSAVVEETIKQEVKSERLESCQDNGEDNAKVEKTTKSKSNNMLATEEQKEKETKQEDGQKSAFHSFFSKCFGMIV